MVPTPPRILVFIRLTLLRRLPRRQSMGELPKAEHRRSSGRQSGAVTKASAKDAIAIVPRRGQDELVRAIAAIETAQRPSTA